MKDWFTDAISIIGTVFSVMGVMFVAVALLVFIKLDAIIASPYSRGDVHILPFIFGAIGAVFLIFGVNFLYFRRRKRKMIQEVVDAGYYVTAKITNVCENFSISINRRHPFYAECQYRDEATNVLHVFRSKNVFYYPDDVIDKDVRVYVDRANFNHYYVDLSTVIGKVQIH